MFVFLQKASSESSNIEFEGVILYTKFELDRILVRTEILFKVKMFTILWNSYSRTGLVLCVKVYVTRVAWNVSKRNPLAVLRNLFLFDGPQFDYNCRFIGKLNLKVLPRKKNMEVTWNENICCIAIAFPKSTA